MATDPGRRQHRRGAGACTDQEWCREGVQREINYFFFTFLVVVNPSAFHNKSQIINKYIPLMTRLFNSRNWKMLCWFFGLFFFTLSPLGAALFP